MKKLLMKLFPRYFTVCQHTFLNFDDLEAPNNALELAIVDDETDSTFDALGISVEKGEKLVKELKKAMIDSNSRVGVMQIMSKHISHINEFYSVVVMMEREIYNRHDNGLGGLLRAMVENDPGPRDE
jgi:hypothetical protein